MITVIAKLTARQGKEILLAEELLRLAGEVIEKEKECTMYVPHVSVKDPAEIVMVEKYINQEAFREHSNTQYFKSTMAVLKELLGAPPEIKVYKELS